MVRTEISLFLKNIPGELGKLTTLLCQEKINIDALSIQSASGYVQALFENRGKTLKQIASVIDYGSIQMDSAEYALIRFLADNSDKAINLLTENNYIFDIMKVVAIRLENHPGALAEVTEKFGRENININYVYGSVSSPEEKCLFVFCPEDIERAQKIFPHYNGSRGSV